MPGIFRPGPLLVVLLLIAGLTAPAVAGASTAGKSEAAVQTASRWGNDANGVPSTRVQRDHPRPAAPSQARPLSPTDPGSLVNDPTADTSTNDTQSSAAIVLGSGSNVIAAFNDSGSNNGSNIHFTGWSSSNNGGASWTDHGTLPDSGSGDGGEPVLARSAATGTVFLVTGGFTEQIVEVFRSSNNGTTFGPPGAAFVGLTKPVLHNEWIAVDNFGGTGLGSVYVAARDYGPGNQIVFSRSTNDGLAWGPNGGLSIASGVGDNVAGPFVMVGPDHSVYVFWYDSTAGNSIRMRKSTDLGVSFGPPITVTSLTSSGIDGDLGLGGGFRSNSFPKVASNPVSGILYVAYNDSISGDKANVYLRQSIDGGAIWSAPVLVNNDGGTNDQWSPSLAVQPNGKKMIVSWYDRRNDPENRDIQRFAGVADLRTGTPTFGQEFAVSPSFPVVVGQDGSVAKTYMGDYDMAAADNSGFYLPWGDNRDGDAAHMHQPDVRFAKVLPKPAAADLTITQKASAGSLAVGAPVKFTLKVHNAGTKAASWVNVTDPVLGGFAVTAVTTTAGACGSDGSCVLKSLAGGHSVTITVHGTVGPAGEVNSTAKVSHAGKDPNSANNRAMTTVNVTGGHTYATNVNVYCSIPDNDPAGVDCPLDVPDAGTLSFVSVSFRIDHTFDGDLQISIVAPDTTTVSLVNERGAGGHNFGTGAPPCGSGTVYTTLGDFGRIPISAGSAPFAGVYAPESPLSALRGHPRAGTWKLHIADVNSLDTGTVLCWNLTTN